jgi:hypothetical protein
VPMNKKYLAVAGTFVFLAGATVALAQIGVMPVATHPGEYTITDRSRIETQKIEWSMLAQKEDQQAYQKSADDSYAAYTALYEKFNALRLIHQNTVVAKSGKAMVDIAVLTQAINDYIKARDLFIQKIAAIQVTQDVWSGLASDVPSQPGNKASPEELAQAEKAKAQALIYKRGSLNLKAFADTYNKAVEKMDSEARELTYRVNNHVTVITTEPKMGLEIPEAQMSPDALKAEFEERMKNSTLTEDEIEDVGQVSIALGRMMLSFGDANSKHLYVFNDLQNKDRDDWIESMQTKNRLLHWTRAVYCMRLGVPGLDLPKLKAFNLDYLVRGMGKDGERMRITQKAEWSEANIRSTLTRFDQLFLSLQSQSGEFNKEGGVMKYLHRVNSALTWHNEVRAYMSIMLLLRENMLDELDLAAGGLAGCEKVRSRYYARYVSLKDPLFMKTVSSFLDGIMVSGSGDDLTNSFRDLGIVLKGKGEYMKEVRKFMKQHPGADMVTKALDDDEIH